MRVVWPALLFASQTAAVIVTAIVTSTLYAPASSGQHAALIAATVVVLATYALDTLVSAGETWRRGITDGRASHQRLGVATTLAPWVPVLVAGGGCTHGRLVEVCVVTALAIGARERVRSRIIVRRAYTSLGTEMQVSTPSSPLSPTTTTTTTTRRRGDSDDDGMIIATRIVERRFASRAHVADTDQFDCVERLSSSDDDDDDVLRRRSTTMTTYSDAETSSSDESEEEIVDISLGDRVPPPTHRPPAPPKPRRRRRAPQR